MTRHTFPFAIKLASTPAEVEAAQALRFRVFVEEMGARAPAACARARREWDRFDEACEHLLLTDTLRQGEVVGTYRLMDERGAARAGGFATEREFDLSALRGSGRRLLELGRSCLDPRARGGSAMHLLWRALAEIGADRGIELVFGLASLPGTDPCALAAPLALLRHEHLAPEAIRPVSRDPTASGPWPAAFDRRAATLALPPLVKGYLRLGGAVGEGGFVDRRFGCTDVCMVLDAQALKPRAGRLLGPWSA
jgi:putative hemolysin